MPETRFASKVETIIIKNMKILIPLLLVIFSTNIASYGETVYPSVTWQITTAVLSAPQKDRKNVTVLGYKSDGTLAVIREGTNDLICLADDPAKEGFSAACYHQSLEKFMARGRALRKEGKTEQEIFGIREEEAKSGKLEMPEKTLLTVLTGKVNEDTQEIVEKHLRYVFYIPFATPETTGLPLAPSSLGGPWIMNPGTHRAHIMITPPKNK